MATAQPDRPVQLGILPDRSAQVNPARINRPDGIEVVSARFTYGATATIVVLSTEQALDLSEDLLEAVSRIERGAS